MEKVVYVLWADRPLDEGEVAALRAGPFASVCVHDAAAAAAPSPAPAPPGEPVHVAVVGAWVDCYQRRAEADAAVAALGLDHHAYLVVESLYEDYAAPPPAGERSPGVLTVALLHRPPGLDEMLANVEACLDLGRLRSSTMSEYLVNRG